jgi:glycosyltransferase involved in cell wall biosynthesis
MDGCGWKSGKSDKKKRIKKLNMLDLSVIILTYNEEIHIRRCIDNIRNLAKDIFIVDSFSTDKTVEIALEYENVSVLENKWENNYARQFNWALDHCPVKTQWVLRLDADEYFTPELVKETEARLSGLDNHITGIILKRRHVFLGKWIKRGTYPVKLLRLFRYKKAVCEQRLMDEHIQLLEGDLLEFENDFVDHNLHDISWWTEKHVGYAIREAVDLLDMEFGFSNNNSVMKAGDQAERKRKKKKSYASKPLFIRSFLYFIYRYIVKLGFLEGKEGFLWHFLQGWWYRTLVDAKIFEIKKHCRNDKDEIKKYIAQKYHIML